MTSQESRFLRLTQVSNNLENFKAVGVLYLYDLPPLPCKGTVAPDGWCWAEFPYEEVFTNGKETFSPIFYDLRYLVNRGYCRVTYKMLDSRLVVLRVYMLPQDIETQFLFESYRTNYHRRGKPLAWHVKTYKSIVLNLISVLDSNATAWNIRNDEQMLEYLKKNGILVFNALTLFEKSDPKVLGNSLVEGLTDQMILDFHLGRLIRGESYTNYSVEAESLGSKDDDDQLQQRLTNIYANVSSPAFNINEMNNDQLETINDILNNEIEGFNSTLYQYQRRSVAKMFQKELFAQSVLVPNMVMIRNGINEAPFYFDIKSLEFYSVPVCYKTPRGGILAEDMGLGKTCICLALICLSKFQISESPYTNTTRTVDRKPLSLLDSCVRFINRNSIPWKKYHEELPTLCTKKLKQNLGYFETFEVKHKNFKTRSSKGVKAGEVKSHKIYVSSSTLVVIPDNLFHQWRSEIKKHVKDGYLSVLEIQNSKRDMPDDVCKFLDNDIILVSLGCFSKQSDDPDSIIRSVYWKRLIIDEGHSMNSKSTRAVALAKQLQVERKWAITGTPTSGLTNLHMEQDDAEYTVKKKFNAREDLVKLGIILSNFFKIEPWCSDSKLWLETVIKPFESGLVNGDLQLTNILQNLLVRHSVKDVEVDIKLPKLHHKPVFLQPSFFDKLSINLFIAVLATNAVTSERTDKDYMFHPSNKSELRRLISNLQRATFYWTGFSIQDIENLLNICKYALKTNKGKYSESDVHLLENSIYTSKVALSNERWRTACTVHEMSYYVSNLPQMFHKSMAVSNYEYEIDDFNNPIGVYGFPQLNAIQKLFYKNRLVATKDEFELRLGKFSKTFWVNYWASSSNNTNASGGMKKTKNKPQSQNFKIKEIDVESVKFINEKPTWTSQFDAREEEQNLTSPTAPFERVKRRRRKKNSLVVELSIKDDESPKKRIKYIPQGRSTPVTPEPIIPEGNFSSYLRRALVLGTASVKLSYLASRLLENQISKVKSLVFYEFENSAYYLTEILDLLGLNYLMYSTYIKVSERSNNLGKFDYWDTSVNGGIVLVMDLKLASHGLTIISATNVFFINPIWNKTIEAQAIKRSHRIGQTKEVFVETLLLQNTIEEEMYNKRTQQEVKQDEKEEGLEDAGKELIDNTGMQEYIMRFEFLRLFEGFEGEYEPIRSESQLKKALVFGDEHNYDDGLKLFSCKSELDEGGQRKWTVPLFTEESLARVTENEARVKGQQKDDRETMETLSREMDVTGKENATKSLISKLKRERKKVRFD